MPDKETVRRAKKDLREGKAPSTAAGEFVKAEMEQFKEGNPHVASREQAIAIGLSEARRAGIPLAPPTKGKASEQVRRKAKRDMERGRRKTA